MEKEDIEYIMNVLRRGTITWSGGTECLNRGRYKKINPRTGNMVWWRDCDAKCGASHMLMDDLFEVDHIVEVGGFKGSWDDYVNRLYCEQSNLQALCFSCHEKKTLEGTMIRNMQRKPKVED